MEEASIVQDFSRKKKQGTKKIDISSTSEPKDTWDMKKNETSTRDRCWKAISLWKFPVSLRSGCKEKLLRQGLKL